MPTGNIVLEWLPICASSEESGHRACTNGHLTSTVVNEALAELIGVKKNIIIVNMGMMDIVMFNPVLLQKDKSYQTEEGCLSLDGVRITTRYQEIEVEYFDFSWKKQKQKYSGWIAQIIQHECDHLEGIII